MAFLLKDGNWIADNTIRTETYQEILDNNIVIFRNSLYLVDCAEVLGKKNIKSYGVIYEKYTQNLLVKKIMGIGERYFSSLHSDNQNDLIKWIFDFETPKNYDFVIEGDQNTNIKYLAEYIAPGSENRFEFKCIINTYNSKILDFTIIEEIQEMSKKQ